MRYNYQVGSILCQLIEELLKEFLTNFHRGEKTSNAEGWEKKSGSGMEKIRWMKIIRERKTKQQIEAGKKVKEPKEKKL